MVRLSLTHTDDEHDAERAGWRRILEPLVGIILLPVFILLKLVLLPFERPVRRERSEVASIIRAMLDGTVSDFVWDDFVCVPIADPWLDEVRQRCAGINEEFLVETSKEFLSSESAKLLRSYVSSEGQAVLRGYIEELEGPAQLLVRRREAARAEISALWSTRGMKSA